MMNPKLLIGVVAIVVGCSAPQGKNAVDRIDQRVDSLMQKMTLAEKIGQMNQLNGFWDVTGPAPEGGTAAMKYEFLQQGLVGSMLGIKSVKEAVDLQRMVMENSRLGIPLIFGFDVIHGFKTTFPIPLAMAASWDLKAVEEATAVAAKEAASAGVNWTFAPMSDVCRDARWGRCMEGCGEDPFLTTQMALAQINGFQGNDVVHEPDMLVIAIDAISISTGRIVHIVRNGAVIDRNRTCARCVHMQSGADCSLRMIPIDKTIAKEHSRECSTP